MTCADGHAIEVQRLCVKAWLAHIRMVHDEVAMCAMRIKEIRETVELTGISYDGVGGGSSDGQAIPRAVVRLMELQDELDRRVEAYLEEYESAISMCSAAHLCRYAVWLHEVERMCWDDVAQRIGYSQQHTRRLADVGVSELYAKMPEHWRRYAIPNAMPGC